MANNQLPSATEIERLLALLEDDEDESDAASTEEFMREYNLDARNLVAGLGLRLNREIAGLEALGVPVPPALRAARRGVEASIPPITEETDVDPNEWLDALLRPVVSGDGSNIESASPLYSFRGGETRKLSPKDRAILDDLTAELANQEG